MNDPAASVIEPRGRAATLDFDRLYRDCHGPLYGYAMTVLGHRATAEDVTARTFERAWRTQRSFDPKRGTERTWLFAIVRGLTLDELRARRHRRTSSIDDSLDHGDPADEPMDRDAARRLDLRDTLRGLPPRDRELIALKFYAGCTNREIARLTERSESSVGTQLCRVLDRLRKDAPRWNA